jgi:hypothetical protein
MSVVRIVVLLFISLAIASALLAISDKLSFYQRFIYCLVYSIIYGGMFYVPFIVGYRALANRCKLMPWSAALLGAGLAALLTAPIWASLSFPAFSGVHFVDAVGWASGGAFYGLAYHIWLAKGLKTPHN